MAEYIDREALKKTIGESTEPFNISSVYRTINNAPAVDVDAVARGKFLDVAKSIQLAKFKGKVADEPDEWVIGYLLKGNAIFQPEPHAETKFCGVGMFAVDPSTITLLAE